MRINNFGYLVKEGIRSIFLHGFMSFAAVCATVACLVIVGSFSCLMYNVNIMVEKLDQTNQVMAYIDENLSEADAMSITTEINMIDNVLLAEFKTREQALQEFIEKNGNDPAFSTLDADTLRHRIVITLEDNGRMRETVKEVQKVRGIEEVTAYYEMAEGFAMVENLLQVASAAVIVVLLVVSLLIISNTVKMAMADRRDEIAIMKMVGATNGFIRLPFVVEGFLLGMTGAGLAFGLEWVIYDAFVERVRIMDSFDIFVFVPFQELLVPMLLIFGACGFFVGVVGSWTSIRKFLNV